MRRGSCKIASYILAVSRLRRKFPNPMLHDARGQSRRQCGFPPVAFRKKRHRSDERDIEP